MTCLEVAANLASILTAAVAAIVAVLYWWDQYRKCIKLEDYLKAERSINPSGYQHTVLHLMAKVGLTEDEILRASFRSRHIRRRLRENRDTHLAEELLFE